MPGGDKTGPNGQGSRTGRGLGNCNEFDHRTSGRLFGGRYNMRYYGRGNGYGRRNFPQRGGYGWRVNIPLSTVPLQAEPKVLLKELEMEKELIEEEIKHLKELEDKKTE